MDDQVLRSLSERLDYLRRLQEQKEKIRASLEEQEAVSYTHLRGTSTP